MHVPDNSHRLQPSEIRDHAVVEEVESHDVLNSEKMQKSRGECQLCWKFAGTT